MGPRADLDGREISSPKGFFFYLCPFYYMWPLTMLILRLFAFFLVLGMVVIYEPRDESCGASYEHPRCRPRTCYVVRLSS